MNTEITIRPIKKKDNKATADMIRSVFHDFDAPQVGTVYSDATTDDLYNLFRADKAEYFVAEYEGNIVGGCGIYPTENLPADVVELVKYYVHKSARGKGLGRKLMEQSIQFAKESGYKRLYLETIDQFDKAVGIYEKQGFKYLDEPMGNSGHHACEIRMVKDL